MNHQRQTVDRAAIDRKNKPEVNQRTVKQPKRRIRIGPQSKRRSQQKQKK